MASRSAIRTFLPMRVRLSVSYSFVCPFFRRSAPVAPPRARVLYVREAHPKTTPEHQRLPSVKQASRYPLHVQESLELNECENGRAKIHVCHTCIMIW